ncbi:MAG: hypothetical protein BRC38_13580 [Cyanobacteria bacterium QH_6_48_35]|nr:MAG: hypothetical protein BRC38_13580 [Cyanobacteria bacterium QH_6_48_35]
MTLPSLKAWGFSLLRESLADLKTAQRAFLGIAHPYLELILYITGLPKGRGLKPMIFGSGMLKNRKLSKAISDLGWYQFRTLLETKATKYEREIQVISRWEPSSQTCSNCGERGGKKHLGIRAWECLSCGSWLDRDINAAKNIKAVGGQSKALNGRGGKRKTNPLAAANEASTSIQLESPRL